MKSKGIIFVLVCLGLIISWALQSFQVQALVREEIRYQTIERSLYTIHTVIIPRNSDYLVSPAITGDLQPIPDFAQANTIAAINGGYFDPVNQKTTSFIVQDAQIVADPRFNERLVDNPDLKQYLRKIFNRAEFRSYRCGESIQYDIQLHPAPLIDNCTLIASLGGGPGLLPQNSSLAEGFIAYQDGIKIRDAIGNDSLNARSAVGIRKDGAVIFAMVEQRPDQPLNSGISLPQLGKEMSHLGAIKAMNLDGGSSASLYYSGQVVYGRVDKEGNKIIRPIKSALLVNVSSS
ncbi:MAG: phosphodiester glycosidase family protein [Cyanobacteria bacterium P01_C01_bin.72]